MARSRIQGQGLRGQALLVLHCQMTLTVVTERAAVSQNDIDASRPPGSSCCTLFCSRLAISVLDTRCTAGLVSESLSMPSLQKLLLQAVREWDKKGLVDGAPAHQV